MIYLADGSSLSAAGERIDNTGAAASSSGIATSGHLNGGTVKVMEQAVTGQGVFVAPSALIDVSGGWQISTAGKVTGGDAGSITLQGSTLVVDGILRGASLIGNKGGSITMTAPNIAIAAAPGALPAGFYPDLTLPLTAGLYGLYGQLVFGANQLDQSGFTNITLKSVNDITMEGGLTLGPSLVKLAQPVPGGGSQDVIPGLFSLTTSAPTTILATQDEIAASSVTLAAGITGSGMTGGHSNPRTRAPVPGPGVPNPSANIFIGAGSTINTAPTGSISVTSPYIDIAGSLNSPSGTTTVKSNQGGDVGTLTLESCATISAAGYVQPGMGCPGEGPARSGHPPSRRYGQPQRPHNPLSRSRRAGERRRVSAVS